MSGAQSMTPLRITADAGDWSATHDGLGTSSYCGIRNEAGEVVALAVAHLPEYGDPDCRSIAARIVQCVNAHDDMLRALRRAVLALAFAAESSPAMRDDYEAVSAAIAKATGGAA